MVPAPFGRLVAWWLGGAVSIALLAVPHGHESYLGDHCHGEFVMDREFDDG